MAQTTPTESLERAMREHKVSAWLQRFEGVETTDGWEHRAWRFALDIGDEPILRNARYSTGMGIKGEPTPAAPTPADFVGSILMDCNSIEGYTDLPAEDAWIVWADDMGTFAEPDRFAMRPQPRLVDRVKGAQRDFREIAARRSLLIERLGEDAYRELIEIASEL